MSAVHKQIARAAFDVLPAEQRNVLRPYLEDLEASSEYPDVFADSAMSREAKDRIDPEADRFLWPDPPQTEWYAKILQLTAEEARIGMAPLRWMYLVEYYLDQAVEHLKAGDLQGTAKFCGVYSHVIGDTAEPIHAVKPEVVDLVVPPPEDFIGLELHANIEGLKAPVDIGGYAPTCLGSTTATAAMNAYAGLARAKQVGAAQAVPIIQALYAGDREPATALSQVAQNESARRFADIVYTVFCLQALGERGAKPLDLCRYPYAAAEIDMVYRYRPIEDRSLVPFSGGETRPLSLRSPDGHGIEQVHGLGVLPSLAPPHSTDRFREASIEYCLVPGAYERFEARVGGNPLFEEAMGAAVFTVQVDEKEAFRSAELRPGDPPTDVRVQLGQARWLRLGMHYSINPTPEQVMALHCKWAIHGVWAKPRLCRN